MKGALKEISRILNQMHKSPDAFEYLENVIECLLIAHLRINTDGYLETA